MCVYVFVLRVRCMPCHLLHCMYSVNTGCFSIVGGVLFTVIGDINYLLA